VRKDLQQLPPSQTINLPTLDELFSDQIEVAGKQEGLNAILNVNPPDKWIKEHPTISNWKYIPIDKVEYLLRKIFKQYRVEVLKTGLLMNAVEVTVRVHYMNPATGELDFQDGVGAQELQTKKDTGALKMDMSNVNRGAVQMALPIAKSYAIKDACELIGNIFGGNLNRKDTLAFQPDEQMIEKSREEQRKVKLQNNGINV